MNLIKNLAVSFFLLLIVSLPIIGRTAPLPGEPESGTGSGFHLQLKNPLKVDTVIDLLKSLLGILIQVGLPIAAIAIIYSGFLMVTSAGNEEKLATAKKAFGFAVLGTLVLLGSWVIITAIQNTVEQLQ